MERGTSPVGSERQALISRGVCCTQVLYPGARRPTRGLSPSHGLDLFSLASVTLPSSPCIFLTSTFTVPHYRASFSALAQRIPSCTWADRFLGVCCLCNHLTQPHAERKGSQENDNSVICAFIMMLFIMRRQK